METQPRNYEACELLPDFSIGKEDPSTTPHTPDTSFGSEFEWPSSDISKKEKLFDEDFGDFAVNAIRTATE